MLNRDLSRLVIIDDNPMSYAFHTRNAIPIDKFEGEDDDVLLKILSSIFDRLRNDQIMKSTKSNQIKSSETPNETKCNKIIKKLKSENLKCNKKLIFEINDLD